MTAVEISATYWMAALYAQGPEGKCECLSIHHIIIKGHATHVVAGVGVHSHPNGNSWARDPGERM